MQLGNPYSGHSGARNSEVPSISGFPEGPEAWRIDWFGDVAFPDRTSRRSQPSVFVHLSKVLSAGVSSTPSARLSLIAASHAQYQKRVWVSVGVLPLLRVGDVWRNTRLDAQPDYELETFTDITIDKVTNKIIKAGLNLDERAYLLPMAEHPWHMQCTQSYCVMVNLPGEKRIIIPCMELIRFYFGSSSSLLAKMFRPDFNRQMLYSDARFNPITGRLQLDLATGISGASAADIGRLHLNSHAWQAAVQVGASCLAATSTQQQAYPKSLFPFEGLTTLVAAGKWLSFGGKPRATFLVYSLRSCSHPFPFKALRYETHSNRPRATTPVQNQQTSATPQTDYQPRGAADVKHQGLVEMDASRSLAPKTRTIRFESKFPDLKKKTIWKNHLLIDEGATKRTQHDKNLHVPKVQQAAVGEPASDRRVRPLELSVPNNHQHENHIPAFLRETVADVSTLTSINVELLSASEYDGWTVPVTTLSDDDGEIDPRLFFDDTEHGIQFRRACILAFKKDREHLYAVIIEARPPYTKLYTTTGENTDEIWLTLRCATTDFLARPVHAAENETLSQGVLWAFGLD